MNFVAMIGNLTKAPELRYTPSAKAVCTIRLACNRKFRDASGAMKEEVTYVDVIAWGRMAESCSQYLDKGSRVAVEGQLVSREWETRDGQRRHTIEVQSRNITFLTWKKGNGMPASEPAAAPSGERHPGEEEDVPF